MANELKQLGKNSTEEFFETIIYMTAYDEAKTRIAGFVEGIEDPVLKEAVESAANVAVFGGIFMLIRYEEALLDKAFKLASVAVGVLLGMPKKFANKLRNSAFRGRKLGIVSKIFSGFSDDAVGKSQIITSQLGNFMSARNNQYQAGNLIQAIQKGRSNVNMQQDSSLNLAKSSADNYVNSLMFKLMTSSFTGRDKTMIKKILGRDTDSALDIEDINKIGSFMFTKDDSGNLTGLTDQFFSLVSGLGYVVKKS